MKEKAKGKAKIMGTIILDCMASSSHVLLLQFLCIVYSVSTSAWSGIMIRKHTNSKIRMVLFLFKAVVNLKKYIVKFQGMAEPGIEW